jgi:hypothetical protein
MDSDSSRGVQAPPAAIMDVIAQNIEILSEKTLRDIAKGPLIKFTLTCDDQQ